MVALAGDMGVRNTYWFGSWSDILWSVKREKNRMKGVILAGGLGTRLKPLTNVLNKHILPVHDKPMIYYPLETMAEAGIKDVMVVVGGQSTEEIMKLLKDGREFGFRRLYYAYQEGEGGIAAALALTEQFVGEDSVCVILGDNILEDGIKDDVKDFSLWPSRAKAGLFVTDVLDPWNYGCLIRDPGGRFRIQEKPPYDVRSGYEVGKAVIGIYFYDSTVFEKIKQCKPSLRGELEISDVNNMYLQKDEAVVYQLNGYWGDAGSSIDGWMTVTKRVAIWNKKAG